MSRLAKRKIWRGVAVLCVSSLFFSPLEAQVRPLNLGGQGKSPTSRDPGYEPPRLPDYLRKKLQPSSDLLIVPLLKGDDSSVKNMLEKSASQKEEKKRAGERYEINRFSPDADTSEDRIRFERSVLRQFGVDEFNYSIPEERESYHETAGRRFQIVFFLSLPITLGFAYGIVSLSKQSGGGSVVLNQGETASFVGAGLISAGIIAWRDNARWEEGIKAAGSGRGGVSYSGTELPGGYAAPISKAKAEYSSLDIAVLQNSSSTGISFVFAF